LFDIDIVVLKGWSLNFGFFIYSLS